MRGLFALVFALLVAANTVSSGAIYRRYREVPVSDAGALFGQSLVSDLRKEQIPVQIVEVVEPVLVAKQAENLRSVEPEVAIAESEPSAVISNEVVPEKLEKLAENLESVRAIEEVILAAKEQEIQQPIAETVVAIVEQGQQQLRNIEPEAPAAPVILKADEVLVPLEKEGLPQAEIAEKKLIAEAPLPEALPAALPAALPEALQAEPKADLSAALPASLPDFVPEALPASIPAALPEALPEPIESLPVIIIEEKKPEEAKPLEAELPLLKSLKEEEPAKNVVPEVQAAKEVDLPITVEKQSELKSLEEQVAPAEVQPQLKSLEGEEQLIESPKLAEKLAEILLLEEQKDEILEKKKEIKEEKKELLKAAIEEAIKEDIKEVLQEKVQSEIQLDPKKSEPIAPSGRQADSADPGPTTARPAQPGFIQQLVQNSPLGQLLNNFNGANSQAAPAENTPIATAATFIQALQNTTSQITNSIQQGFQQQLQSLQTTFTGQQPQQAAVVSDAAAPAAATPRPQGPFQSIVTSFLGNGAQPQQQAAPASPPSGPFQGILNLFGGNRAPSASPASPAPATQPIKEEAAPSEPLPAAAVEASPQAARDSVEQVDDSLEAAKPDEIVVNDDDTHE